jgi:EpsI family protein
MRDKHFVIVATVLLVTLLISVPAYLIVPQPKNEPQVAMLPMQIGAWQGKDLGIDEKAYEILETRNLILREYSRGGEKVYLYIIYSLDNRKVSHPPEICFEGAGATVTDKEKIPFELGQGKQIVVNKLFLEKAGVQNAVIYWYKAGKKYMDNYLAQQLSVALARLRFKSVGSALIRFSSEVEPGQKGLAKDHALENIGAFVKEASQYFEKVLP